MSLKKDLIDKQARFWVVMASGATLTGASETVGVSRATGRKWRQATGGRIPRRRPKGTDLSVHSPQRLLEVATELNGRARKTLGGSTPAKAMQRLLSEPQRPIVATTDSCRVALLEAESHVS